MRKLFLIFALLFSLPGPIASEAPGYNFPPTAGSGSGTPGGSDTQLQYNDAGAFNGAAKVTYTKASDLLTFSKTAGTAWCHAADDSATYGYFNFVQEGFTNPTSGRKDQVWGLGFNRGSGGGRVDMDSGCIGLSFESYYAPDDTTGQMEFHISSTALSGGERRPFSMFHRLNDDNLTAGFYADHFIFGSKDQGTQVATINATLSAGYSLEIASGAGINKVGNNEPYLSSYLSSGGAPVFYVDSHDIVQIGAYGFNNAPHTPATGVSAIENLTIRRQGNDITQANCWGGGVGVISLFNYTEPTGSVTDGVLLYAKDVSSSSELFVRDEAGNKTQLSPHAKDSPGAAVVKDEPNAVVIHHTNAYLGTDEWIHLSALAKEVERLSGKKFIFSKPIAKADWDADQNARQAEYDRDRAAQLKALTDYQAGEAARKKKGLRENPPVVREEKDIRKPKPDWLK